MKIDKYILFSNTADAQKLIDAIDKSKGSDHWCDPNINPFDHRAIVSWNNEYLKAESHLINGLPTISFDQAQEEGWAFGFHTGCFAKARVKLEEAQLIRGALDSFDHNPNYPAYRALFFGLLSSLYAVKEAIRQSCKRIGNQAETWWNPKFDEIKNDELLWFFYDLNNEDKHSISSPFLRPRMMLYEYKGVGHPGMVFSGEGVFFVENANTAKERRIFCEGAKADFEVYLDINSISHKGSDITGLSLKAMLDLAIGHYQDLVFEARSKFDNLAT